MVGTALALRIRVTYQNVNLCCVFQEGDLCLAVAKFIEEHPIIYWNMVWAFERINVQTHLPNLCLKNRVDNINLRNGDSGNVRGNGDSVNGVGVEEGNGLMQPVEEGADPLTQELATVGKLNVLS